MERLNNLDDIDRTIWRILSVYESLDLLQVWYELGECDPPVERITEEEVLGRLESLKEIGLVECVTRTGGEVHWALKKREPKGSSKGLQAS